jgi:hypothetical protein
MKGRSRGLFSGNKQLPEKTEEENALSQNRLPSIPDSKKGNSVAPYLLSMNTSELYNFLNFQDGISIRNVTVCSFTESQCCTLISS